MYKINNFTFDILNVQNEELVKGLKKFKCEQEIDSSIYLYNLKYVNNFEKINFDDASYINTFFAFIEKSCNKYFIYFYNSSVYAIVEENNDKSNIYLLKDIMISKIHKYFLPSLLGLETKLINDNAFCFHSSYISYKNQGILFSAPSGGGKSTQADLWMKYKNAEILNGDRNIVGKNQGHWFVYGTPFSGSSEYCVNRTTPLNAIIILEKGPINQIKRLDIRGFNRVFSQTTVCPWDQEFCNKVMDLVMSACSEVPVYLYSCTKDESAVDFLYEALVKDGAING